MERIKAEDWKQNIVKLGLVKYLCSQVFGWIIWVFCMALGIQKMLVVFLLQVLDTSELEIHEHHGKLKELANKAWYVSTG